MKPRHKRAAVVLGGLLALGLAAALTFNALGSNMTFYITPSQVAQGQYPKDKAFRVGGLVKNGSLRREGLDVFFVVTDLAQEVPVQYHGILPDLFRQGKGTVVQGKLGADGTLLASEVLAKHDENYMPPAAKDALQQAASKPLTSP